MNMRAAFRCNVSATLREGCCALVAALVGALASALACEAAAQTFPQRAVRVIAPFPPGNAADVVSRAMNDRLAQKLGQPVVIENRAGGAGIIGVESVVKAPADGHTLLITSISPVAILPSVYRKLPYDVEKDLTPITMVGFTSMILVTSPNLAAGNLQELVALLKSQAGKHNYAHIGAGTISHLIMETFRLTAGVDVFGIPYKGSGLALAEMLGGQVSLMVDGMTSANTQVKAGKVRALAVTSLKRSPFAPDVPTLGEAGFQSMHDLNMIAWIGLFAPAGTPRPIVDRLHREVQEVTTMADVRERLGNVSVEASPSETPEKFGQFVRNELAKWAKIATGAGVYQSQ